MTRQITILNATFWFHSIGTTYYYPSIQSVRNGRPNGRERRDTLDNKQAEPSPDDLYRVMIMAAEGYVRLKSPE